MNMHSDHALFARIREGMAVVDANNDPVGTVADLKFPEEGENAIMNDTGNSILPNQEADRSLIGSIATAIAGDDDVPDTLRRRMLQEGYIQLDEGGVLTGDRYVLGSYIAAIYNDRIALNVTRDALIDL